MRIRDARGFSLIEIMIGMLLIGFAAVALIGVMHILSTGTATSTEKAMDTDLRASVTQALSHATSCPSSIQVKPGSTLTPGGGNIPISIVDASIPGNPPVISDGQNINGVVYNVDLVYPSHIVTSGSDATFPAGNGRATNTTRYLAEIMLTANRPSTRLGTPTTTNYVPLYMELDSNNNIESCGTDPNDEDEPLYSPAGADPLLQHTVRDCMVAGGFPYPTDIGLLCRFPVFVRNTGTSAGPTEPTPSCTAPWITTTGWHDPPSGIYTSTRGTDFQYTKCTNQSTFISTNYHYLSNTPIESASFVPQSGTGSGINWGWQAAGITIGASVAMSTIMATSSLLMWMGAAAAFGPAGLMVAGVVFIIFAITHHGCKNAPQVTVYAQPIAVGCY